MTISLSLLGGAGWQFLDNSGNVLSGGLLYTYAAGTTTPLTTYTSLTGLTANSNPIILDSAGRVPLQIWLTDGSAYKFVLQTSAAVQIGAWDNVYAPGVNSISFGTTGLTPATATQGTVTVAGTLNVANGGTGLRVAQDAIDVGTHYEPRTAKMGKKWIQTSQFRSEAHCQPGWEKKGSKRVNFAVRM
jgi:hypothetical protein